MALTDGIVGCWSPSLGASGYRLLDRSGRGNHCTLNNMDAGTDWIGTPVGLALDYDGANDNATGAAQSLSGLSVVTVCAWYNPRTRKSYGGIVSTASAFDETMPTQWILYDNVATNAGRVGIVAGGSRLVTGASNSTLNEWQQYVGVIAGAASKIYRNGIEQTVTGSVGAIVYDATTSIKFASYTSSNGYNDARIGETAIYNRALTAGEVLDLYRRGNGAIGRALTGQTRRRTYGFVATGARRRRILCGDYS